MLMLAVVHRKVWKSGGVARGRKCPGLLNKIFDDDVALCKGKTLYIGHCYPVSFFIFIYIGPTSTDQTTPQEGVAVAHT